MWWSDISVFCACLRAEEVTLSDRHSLKAYALLQRHGFAEAFHFWRSRVLKSCGFVCIVHVLLHHWIYTCWHFCPYIWNGSYASRLLVRHKHLVCMLSRREFGWLHLCLLHLRIVDRSDMKMCDRYSFTASVLAVGANDWNENCVRKKKRQMLRRIIQPTFLCYV